MRCIDLNTDTLKMFGTHFSCNEKLKEQKKLYKIERVLKIWNMKKLTVEGKIVVFKTIVISKIVFQAFITTVPRHIVNEQKNTKSFFFGIILLLE